MLKKRKARSDRNHAIYRLSCNATKESYIGVTVVLNGDALASVHSRFTRHLSRAKLEQKKWKLCEALREYGRKGFTCKLLEVIRGKTAAHVVERLLTAKLNPVLNTL